MKFKNNKEGRMQVVSQINDLVKQGYSRTDYRNDKVVVEKDIIKGKVCSKSHILEYKFVSELGEIHLSEREEFSGIEKAKELLYGWSSPMVEASNAVKAGLFSNDDVEILKRHYDKHEWLSKK